MIKHREIFSLGHMARANPGLKCQWAPWAKCKHFYLKSFLLRMNLKSWIQVTQAAILMQPIWTLPVNSSCVVDVNSYSLALLVLLELVKFLWCILILY